ncbi:type II toxin-antitoxin system prevent-host-death family antitoxin [Modestobacter lapidis]|nr:type II toxin-antitoxin system prevent-host-death family antitoxin [Modestobacter lapidis]
MTRIGVRELRQNASVYLDMVKAGETVEVTERGRLVAVLAPPSPASTARERLIAEGRLIPARGPRALPARVSPAPGRPTASEALAEDRAEAR